jgi:hypothetical protein
LEVGDPAEGAAREFLSMRKILGVAGFEIQNYREVLKAYGSCS